jgi:hypothetical protein
LISLTRKGERLTTHLATAIAAGTVLSLSLLGLGGPIPSFPFPLSLKLPPSIPELSHPPLKPNPRVFAPSFVSLTGDPPIESLLAEISVRSGSSSGLPKASGLELPPVIEVGIPRLALLPLLPLLRDGPAVDEPSSRVRVSYLLDPGYVGDSRLGCWTDTGRGGDSLTGLGDTGDAGPVPLRSKPVLDRRVRMSKALGVRI